MVHLPTHEPDWQAAGALITPWYLCWPVVAGQVRFSVPKDAVQLDFVFSNVQSGDGIYDNRGGFDYHMPIKGGTGTHELLSNGSALQTRQAVALLP